MKNLRRNSAIYALIDHAITKANDIIKYLGLSRELENLEIGITVKDLGTDYYGRALSPIFMVAIDIDNILGFAQLHNFDSCSVKDIVNYLVLHEVTHVYLDTLDYYPIYQEYDYFRYIPVIQDMYLRSADLMKVLSTLGLNLEDFGHEISHNVIKNIVRTLDRRLTAINNDELKKSLYEIRSLFNRLSMMHHDIGHCDIYDYNCVHYILSNYAKICRKLFDEIREYIELVKNIYDLRGLKPVIMSIVSGFFMYEHERRLTYLPDTHSLIEALCYYVPAKIMFGDVNKVLSMPVVDKFHKLLTKLDSISFDKVINVIRKPGCIIEKLMELGLFKK